MSNTTELDWPPLHLTFRLSPCLRPTDKTKSFLLFYKNTLLNKGTHNIPAASSLPWGTHRSINSQAICSEGKTHTTVSPRLGFKVDLKEINMR